MAVAKKENGTNGDAVKFKYVPELTDQVIASTGPKANPRLAQIMPSLVRHLHDFAREVDLTISEWMLGVDMINEAGHMSDDKRNETSLLCDILGLETLTDVITTKLLLNANSESVTPTAILGPFYRANAPFLPNDSSIILAPKDSEWYKQAEPMLAHLSGRVTSASTGQPLSGATVDVWLAGPNGLYEQQDPSVPDMNLRGRFLTDSEGRYALYGIRPTTYPIPEDGPAGRFLKLLDRHPHRPAHVHFMVSAPGFRTVITQVYDHEDPHAADDVAFSVKDRLIVKFEKREGDEKAYWGLDYDFVLGEA